MAVHSKSSRVLVNTRHLSGSISGYSVSHQRAVSPTTALLDEGARYIPGLLNGAISLNGMFDSAAGGIDETVRATIGADDGMLVTVLPDGMAVGRPAYFAAAETTQYTVDTAVAEAVTITVEGQPEDGADWGVSLHGHSVETATGVAAAVDNGAGTTGGAVAALHVTGNTSDGTSTVKVQHSVDDNVWVDLATFAAIGAAQLSAERLTVTGTVNRYIRASWTLAGSGDVTFVVVTARR